MVILKTKKDLQNWIMRNGSSIGFVPTMGALHNGHISLVSAALEIYNLCVVSIFVNPTQFNNQEDFEKYPEPLEADINMLEAAGCHCLFLPAVETIYPQGMEAKPFPIGDLENMLEGAFRPGHYQGVVQVVDILLDAVKPDGIFLGEKDYQQFMVLSVLINKKYPDVQMHLAATIREASGLAMSSRNMRLSPEDKIKAVEIFNTLFYIKENLLPGNTNKLIEQKLVELDTHGFKTDYLTIADARTLEPVNNWDGKKKVIALVATYLNDVRLIDNMTIN